MAISTMYPAMPGSPKTALTAQIAANATSATVDDISALPAAPNICVLGDSTSAEIVSYTGISGSTLTGLVRGLGGTTASVWPADTVVARNFTSFDHDRFKLNIESLAGEINDVVASDFDSTANYSIGDYVIKEGALYRFTSAHSAGAWDAGDVTAVTVTGELKSKANASALSSYAPIASPSFTGTPTTPTPSATDGSTKIANTLWVQGQLLAEIMEFTLQTVSVSANWGLIMTVTSDALVAESTVLSCVFADPASIKSDVDWYTNASGNKYVINFYGVCSTAQTATVIVGKRGYQNPN